MDVRKKPLTRPKRRWEGIFKMGLNEIGLESVGCSNLSQDTGWLL
jgi:hypothetical protein